MAVWRWDANLLLVHSASAIVGVVHYGTLLSSESYYSAAEFGGSSVRAITFPAICRHFGPILDRAFAKHLDRGRGWSPARMTEEESEESSFFGRGSLLASPPRDAGGVTLRRRRDAGCGFRQSSTRCGGNTGARRGPLFLSYSLGGSPRSARVDHAVSGAERPK